MLRRLLRSATWAWSPSAWQEAAGRWHKPSHLSTGNSSDATSLIGSATRSFASHSSNDVDCVVIGAGVVGLACARALAQQGAGVMLLEKAAAIGTETSARHSEVIHAGIYYQPGSLKAQLCVEGARLLYSYCADKGVEFKRLGKLIVATDMRQAPMLHQLHQTGLANGVAGLQLLSSSQAREMEPELRCVAALHSPASGIFDSHSYMQALLADAEAAGASLAVHAQVVGGKLGDAQKVLHVVDTVTGEQSELTATYVVNAAGLDAQSVSQQLGLPAASIPQRHLARGCYFSLSGTRAPFSRLIYPVPERGGLGTHLTLDLGGQARFGPDVEWVDDVSYTVDPDRADKFYPEVRKYWPGLPEGALVASYAGVRPKISGPGEPTADFCIQGALGRYTGSSRHKGTSAAGSSISTTGSSSSSSGSNDGRANLATLPGGTGHGVQGLVCLYGIESPGLTSSMAIGQRVAQLLL